MDKHRLVELRGKLRVAEIGFETHMFRAIHIREIVDNLLEDYPEMPDEERERVEDLRLAATKTRGWLL